MSLCFWFLGWHKAKSTAGINDAYRKPRNKKPSKQTEMMQLIMLVIEGKADR